MVDVEGAIARLMRFLAVEGITGQEQKISQEIRRSLVEVGVPDAAIRYDTANERIPLPTQTGNLIVDLPGTPDMLDRPRVLFMTHMDTVPLCAKAIPVRDGNTIRPKSVTALGGDNRTGCAVLVTLAETLLRDGLPHPPMTLLFTVREESGLYGARYLDPADLMFPKMGFNFDGRSASDIIVGAVGADRWEVEIRGKASHAGVHPDRGISATAIFSLAIADIYRNGWFGKVRKGEREGTSNVGSVGDASGRSAGEATNVVTDYVEVRGESRSRDPEFVTAISNAYREAFARAVGEVRDLHGETGSANFTSHIDYYPFRMNDDEPVIRYATAAVEAMGLTPTLATTNGGLDANWICRHGIPTVTFGAGQHDIHTVKEWVDLEEFARGCRLAVGIVAELAKPG